MRDQIDVQKLVKGWRDRPLSEISIAIRALNAAKFRHGSLPREIAAERNAMVNHVMLARLQGEPRS
jgi:hypothetical protein